MRIIPDSLRMGISSGYPRIPKFGEDTTLKHIFQKNAIEFETRVTRHEQRDTRQEDNLYDSVCDVMRFRIFTEISA